MTKKATIFDIIVTCYIIASLVVFLLFMCAPLVSLIRNTALYHIQTLLGLIGCLILLGDFITNRIFLKGRGVFFLLIVLLCFCGSSIYTYAYGIKSNLFLITWTALHFTLFYSFSYRAKRVGITSEMIHSFLKIISLTWMAICLWSFLSFIFNVGYLTTTIPNSFICDLRQGFFNNRLFGVTKSINQASILSSILLIYHLYRFRSVPLRASRIYNAIVSTVLLIQIILSGSRSPLYALYSILFLVTTYLLMNRFRTKTSVIKSGFISILTALLITSSAIAVTPILKSTLCLLPASNFAQEHHLAYAKFTKNFIPCCKITSKAEEGLIVPGDSTELLDRKDTVQISNHRFEIWKDYIHIAPSFGLIGLSPGNYDKIIQKRHPDSFIVSHIKNNYPDMFKEGKVYHPHNTYLMMLIAGGYIGFLSIMVFLISQGKACMSYLISSIRPQTSFFCCFLIITLYIITSFFDNGMWLDANFLNALFWLILGYMTSEVSLKKVSD